MDLIRASARIEYCDSHNVECHSVEYFKIRKKDTNIIPKKLKRNTKTMNEVTINLAND